MGYFSKQNNLPAAGEQDQIQFNNGGRLAGDPKFTWDSINDVLNVDGDIELTGTIDGIDIGNLDQEVVKLTGDQTIDGIKTFLQFPFTPSSAPTSNFQVANKKYVDDNAGGLPCDTIENGEEFTVQDCEQLVIYEEYSIEGTGELILIGDFFLVA